MKYKLLATTGLLVVALQSSIAPAQAQTTAAAAVQADPTVGGSSIADIIVTAQRRSESVQKSSLAISVLQSAALKDAGVSQLRDLMAATSGVIIGQGGPTTQVYIRGIGDAGSTPNTNPSVATYIDGVYVARANSIDGNFFDIQRVEILKGPQGTLYGRNSAGGALNILSNVPRLDKVEAALNFEGGNYKEINVDGMINMPLGEKAALRGAFQVVSRDGYSSQGFDDDHKQSGRLTLLVKPSSDVSLRVTGGYTHVGGTGPGYDLNINNFPTAISSQLAQLSGAGLPAGGVTVPTDPRISVTDPRAFNVFWGVERLSYGQRNGGPGEVGPFNGVTSPPWCVPVVGANTASVNGVVTPLPFQNPGLCNALFNGRALPSPPGGLVTTWDPSRWQAYAHQDNRYWNLSAELTANLGFANLTILPAYRSTQMDYSTYPVALFDNGGRSPETSKSGSLEVRLSKDTKLVNLVIGGYVFKEKQDQYSGSDTGELQSGYLFNTYNPTHIRTNNFAFFGQGTWHLSDQLRLITGLRYSHETKRNYGQNISVFPSTDFLAGQPCFNSSTTDCVTDAWNGRITFNAVNWKAGIEYDLSPTSMLYATGATGFKAGGLNTRSINYPTDVTPIPFKPEKLTAFELGSRNRFLGGRLQVNIEAFYWLYKDHQESVSYANPAGKFLSATLNAGSAKVYGADVDIVARATSADTLRFNAEYNHSRYTKFTYLSTGNIQGVDTGCAVTPSGTGQSVDCSGFPLSRAPLWTGSGSWTHSFQFGGGSHIDATLSGQYSSKYYLSNFFNNQVLAPSNFVGNFTANYIPANGRWSFGAFVRNFTDEVVYTGAFAIRGLNHGIQAVNVGAPRTYGVRGGLKF
ncbi:iron complex outermembrane receptor protein [Sphingomonas vulcanisoli]|uniref:Iron complex outermembrane receptor protein n=1 Tax=Sphingomonas vulcanisoli TaxID=1658060 RepID=A0ABX0TUN3_9SPHN|nr:TonB-dependent receptor [Sphingomonas vulcanisoli]NIJ09227.1 iron complex outermembrane receptor protein [Sphingomonas vulcanisoli]